MHNPRVSKGGILNAARIPLANARGCELGVVFRLRDSTHQPDGGYIDESSFTEGKVRISGTFLFVHAVIPGWQSVFGALRRRLTEEFSDCSACLAYFRTGNVPSCRSHFELADRKPFRIFRIIPKHKFQSRVTQRHFSSADAFVSFFFRFESGLSESFNHLLARDS